LVCWEWLDEGVSRLGFQPFLLTRSPSGDLVAFPDLQKRLPVADKVDFGGTVCENTGSWPVPFRSGAES
jgi:hypothetical protein